jgi:nitronate monooxygenase
MRFPPIIQGGMGVAVSRWPLARAVSQLGQIGVVSGTALDVVFARHLQLGDEGGHLRRAMEHFPVPGVGARIIERYFIPGGKAEGEPYKPTPVHSAESPASLIELIAMANFVEIYLAKEGHDGLVGINYMEKLQLPTLPSLLGAMLAGVNFVLMGAGIPRAIPGIMDRLCAGEPAEMRLDVEGAGDDAFFSRLDPVAFCGGNLPPLTRPDFLAIISSTALAQTLHRKAGGRVDGFIVEGATAGGHNAPPRGPMQLDAKGQPIYSERDLPDLEQIKALGLPFWLAGSYGEPSKLAAAQAAGAEGVQVGTAFAFCDESGIREDIKAQAIQASIRGDATVFTDPRISPTGFPFKVLNLEGTVSDPEVNARRQRICDVGFLRHPYRKPDGTLGYRCPAEPVESYVAKGGDEADTLGRKCVCNGLSATVGLQQHRCGGYCEAALVTAGDDAVNISRYLKPGSLTYSAADVVEFILGDRRDS